MVKKSFAGSPTGYHDGLILLGDILSAGEVCKEHSGSCCDHSDIRNCLDTVRNLVNQKEKEKRSLALRTHRSISKRQRKTLVKISVTATLLPITPPAAAAAEEAPINPPATVDENFLERLRARVSEAVGGQGMITDAFTLVIRKKLTRTDMNPHNSRLSIPMNQILNDFLTEEENAKLNESEKIKIGFFLDPNLERVAEVTLAKWKMEKSSVYNITRGWKTVLKRKELNLVDLALNDEIELWSFRTVTGELGFVLVTMDTRRRVDVDAAVEQNAD